MCFMHSPMYKLHLAQQKVDSLAHRITHNSARKYINAGAGAATLEIQFIVSLPLRSDVLCNFCAQNRDPHLCREVKDCLLGGSSQNQICCLSSTAQIIYFYTEGSRTIYVFLAFCKHIKLPQLCLKILRKYIFFLKYN